MITQFLANISNRLFQTNANRPTRARLFEIETADGSVVNIALAAPGINLVEIELESGEIYNMEVDVPLMTNEDIRRQEQVDAEKKQAKARARETQFNYIKVEHRHHAGTVVKYDYSGGYHIKTEAQSQPKKPIPFRPVFAPRIGTVQEDLTEQDTHATLLAQGIKVQDFGYPKDTALHRNPCGKEVGRTERPNNTYTGPVREEKVQDIAATLAANGIKVRDFAVPVSQSAKTAPVVWSAPQYMADYEYYLSSHKLRTRPPIPGHVTQRLIEIGWTNIDELVARGRLDDLAVHQIYVDKTFMRDKSLTWTPNFSHEWMSDSEGEFLRPYEEKIPLPDSMDRMRMFAARKKTNDAYLAAWERLGWPVIFIGNSDPLRHLERGKKTQRKRARDDSLDDAGEPARKKRKGKGKQREDSEDIEMTDAPGSVHAAYRGPRPPKIMPPEEVDTEDEDEDEDSHSVSSTTADSVLAVPTPIARTNSSSAAGRRPAPLRRQHRVALWT